MNADSMKKRVLRTLGELWSVSLTNDPGSGDRTRVKWLNSGKVPLYQVGNSRVHTRIKTEDIHIPFLTLYFCFRVLPVKRVAPHGVGTSCDRLAKLSFAFAAAR